MTKSRPSAGSVILTLSVVLAVVLAAGFVFVEFVRPALTGPIASISFSQSKAVPNFDTATRTITDPTKLATMHELMDTHAVLPELVGIAATTGCVGGTNSSVTLTFTSGRVAEMHFYDCRDNHALYGTFTHEATQLLDSWR